jgi:peptidoglycan/xylan/chitin deacetylase (PgdA/CDA1 family)
MGSLRVAGEVDRAEGSFYLCLAGLAPVNNRLAAGSLLSLGQTAEAPLRLIGEYRAARITDAARQSASARQAEGGVVFAEGAGGQGRAVAYAFSENAWAYRAEALYNLVDDTLGWLARQPMLLPADWPHGQRSATVLAMDVSTDFDQALAFADTLKKQNDPASYFLLSNEAGAHPDTVRRLAREGDVGALGDSETPFAGQNSATQGQRIARMQAELDRLMPVPGQLKGFHSPGERDDRRTEPLLYEAGLRHHLTPPAPSEALLPLFPEFRQTDPKDRFIKLPRALRDDTALGAVASADVLAGLQSDQDLARELGGLGVLSLHSALYGPESPVRLALPALLEHIHRDTGSVWLATASQVSAWWREREAFKMAVRYYGKRVEFDVSVVGREAVNGGTLVLMLPAANRLPVIAGVKVGMPLPKLRQLDPFRVALVFESLAEGNYIYQATFP